VRVTVTTNNQGSALDLGQIVGFDNVDHVIASESRPAVFPLHLGTLFLDSRRDIVGDLGKFLRLTHCVMGQLAQDELLATSG